LAETDFLSVSGARALRISSLEPRGFRCAQKFALDREAAKHRDRALRTTSPLTGESCILQTRSAMFLFRPVALYLVDVAKKNQR
jgi:hypothetical protein